MKKLFTLFLALVASVGMMFAEVYSGNCGETGDGSNLQWSLNTEDSVLTITGSGAMKDFQGCAGTPWYMYDEKIKILVLPEDLSTIGNYAFCGCTNLTSVDIPANVTSIGGYAFSSCYSMKKVTFHNNVASMGIGAFYRCTALKKIYYTGTLKDWVEHDYSELMQNWAGGSLFINGEKVENVHIPDEATKISTCAFYGCSDIHTMYIGRDVRSIGNSVFAGCNALKTIVYNAKHCLSTNPFQHIRDSITSFSFGESVDSIPEYLCYSMKKIQTILIPDNVTFIGRSAFSGCNSLPVIDGFRYADTYLIETIDKSLPGYVIPEHVKFIGSNAFKDCSNISSIILPNGIISIGEAAFRNCSSLQSIIIPENVTYIGAYALYDCNSLTSITWNAKMCNVVMPSASNGLTNNQESIISFSIGDNVETIPDGLCKKMSITSISFPNSVTYIGVSAFSECTSLTGTLVIPEGMTSISSSAFRKCAFSNIILPSTLEEIGSCAFYNNRGGGIKHLVIPDNVTRIGSEAFYYDGIAKLTIGKKVTTIENGAFYYAGWCPLDTIIWNAENGPNPFYYYTSGGGNANTIRTNIKHITIGEEVQTVPSALFEDLPNLNSIEWNAKHVEAVSAVRGTTTNVKKVIFTPTCEYIPANFCSQMKNLQDLYLPNTITEIGKDAFMWCSGLENIHYDGTLSDWCSGILADLMTRWKGGNIFLGTDTLKELIVPEDITAIVAHRFEKCKSLTSVYVPDHVQTIDEAAFSNCENVKSVILGNGLTSLPASAFNNCKALTTLTLGKNIKTIYDNAFYGCENIEVIYNYREKPGVLYSTSFDGVDKFSCILYVPAGSLAMYKAAAGWKDFFDIREMGGGVESNIVQVVTTDNTATFNWNNIAEVNTYTLVIWADAEQTELFCSLTFNALGYLININFGSTINRAPAHTNNLSGLSFTVTGLEENHLYNYEFKALAANNDILDNKQGTFVTDGQTYTEAIDQITNDQSSINKVMMDGQIYILRGEKVYTLQGQEVK